VTEIVWITDPLPANRADALDRLGGKGTGLAEMVQRLDLPVPPAFVITTDACRAYLADGWPDGLEDQVYAAVDELGLRSGRSFGASSAPLLVSVRSGAPVSMPGMMDTILNVGVNAAVAGALAAESGNTDFAVDTLARFRKQFEATVGGPPPDDPHEQLLAAIDAVFRSWNSDRARMFRDAEGITDDLGTAVVVQAMVFGNLDDHSGTGVLFTRDPTSGVNLPYGDYLARAQGEDVVAGTHEVRNLAELAADMPTVHTELLAIGQRLEKHYVDMCDIEFTVASGELFILQTRVGRRSPEAAVRIAVDMAQDDNFPLTREEAVGRIDHATFAAIAALAAVEEGAVPLATGIAASPGVARGVLSTDPDEAAELARAGTAVVLVRAETSPADVHGMVGAAGLVTSLGGSVSHAAVVARSWGIPAVTGATALKVSPRGVEIDGHLIPVATVITVDGTTGRIFEGDRVADHDCTMPELDLLRQWALDAGIDLGNTASDAPAPEAEYRDIGRLDVFRALALKGVSGVDALAHSLQTDRAAVDAIIEEAGDLVTRNALGLMLTPDARRWLDKALADERAAVDASPFNEMYERFLVFNKDFKILVTEWQTGSQDAASLAATIDALHTLDATFAPMVHESVGLAPRLRPYAARFAQALHAFTHGDVSMLASPLKDSYHTVWFEYHEELIHLGGRNRAEEEAAGR
jgi:pyruvate,orthophosphate dikinase